MAVTTTTQTFATSKGIVEGVKLEWATFSLLLLTAPNGFLACGIFDPGAINKYGRAAAIIDGAPDNPIGTLERCMERTIVRVNEKGAALGMTVGMSVQEALALLF